MNLRHFFLTCAAISLPLLISSTHAATLIDSNTITATAGSNFDASGTFDASNTVDGLITEGNRDAHQGTHWLAANGTFTETITFDLGGSYALSHMDVLNTSNSNWNDSETDTFTVAYSTDGTNFSAPSGAITLQDFDLGFQTVPLSGTASHVQLVVTNSGVVDGNPPPVNEARVGLNEVRFSQIPEPSAAFLGGIGMLILLRRRRH